MVVTLKQISEQTVRELLEEDPEFFGELVNLGVVDPQLESKLCSWCNGLVYSNNSITENHRIFDNEPCFESIKRLRKLGHHPERFFDQKSFLPIHPVSDLLD